MGEVGVLPVSSRSTRRASSLASADLTGPFGCMIGDVDGVMDGDGTVT